MEEIRDLKMTAQQPAAKGQHVVLRVLWARMPDVPIKTAPLPRRRHTTDVPMLLEPKGRRHITFLTG